MLAIENAFKVLKENPDSEAAREILEKSAEDIFSYKFHISIVEPVDGSALFFMSVYPDRSTVDKIVESIANNDSHMISTLWKRTKEWTVEIDRRLFNNDIIFLTYRELTAIFCHEIGHIIKSNSIPYRIVTILQYELAKSSVSNKSLIRDRFFRKLLSLPILNACMSGDHDKDNLKNEIKADKYVKSMGYQNDLISVFRKYQTNKKVVDANKDMKKMSAFTIEALNQFKKRETALLEYTLGEMIKDCSSTYVESVLTEIHNDFFYENENSSVTKEKRLNFLYERADQLEDEFIATEFFGFKKTNKLKRIDPAELDLVAIKIKNLKTISDKMMLVSYIHSKLDIVEYYIALLKNPDPSKKYVIPHSLKELEELKVYLNKMIQDTINAKLPDRLRGGLLVAWPEGYEG